MRKVPPSTVKSSALADPVFPSENRKRTESDDICLLSKVVIPPVPVYGGERGEAIDLNYERKVKNKLSVAERMSELGFCPDWLGFCHSSVWRISVYLKDK